MSEISDLIKALQALQLERFAALPESVAASVHRDGVPIRIGVVGAQSSLVLNCLVRDVLFHETSLPTKLCRPAGTVSPSVEFGKLTEPLEDARDWKPLQRATYLKKLRAKIDEWALQEAKKGETVVINYPFTNPFAPTAVEFQNFRDGADVVLDTWQTRRPTDGAEQLAISSTLGKFEGLQPRVALASAVAGVSSPELKFFDTMVARIIAPAVRRAASSLTAPSGITDEAMQAVTQLRSTAEAAQKLATAIHVALGQPKPENPAPLKRVPSNSASPSQKKVIQMQLTEKAPPELVAAHVQDVLPGTDAVPRYAVETRTDTPYIANEEPEPGWHPSQASWSPRDPEWRPMEPEWKPHQSEWTPSAGADWKPKIPSFVKDRSEPAWKPKEQTWKPADSSWKPRPPEWQDATEPRK